jgi:hypothetical protein
MFLFHGNPPAAVAHKLHLGEFFRADVGRRGFRFPAKGALASVVAGIAQMTGFFRYRTASLTCVSHGFILSESL